MELDNREALRKMREFRELMDEEEFSDSLEKLKVALERLKMDVDNTTRETISNTKSINVIRKKTGEMEST